jgi:NAD(P)-dependent dehydrogenase (short-subunit alcohol dehydrogenase family)
MSEVHFEDPNFEHRAWDAVSAYGQSKTASIYMANYIDRTHGRHGLHAWSLQPGGIASNLIRVSEEEKQAIYSNPAIFPWVKTPEQGAATTVWAAIAKDLEGKGGRYLESMQEIGEWKGPLIGLTRAMLRMRMTRRRRTSCGLLAQSSRANFIIFERTAIGSFQVMVGTGEFRSGILRG